jgi:hypothetical protein
VSPDIDDDDRFDARFRAIAGSEPSEVLGARTLAGWRAQRSRHALGVRVVAGLGMLGMAAMTLLVVRDVPERGRIENLVERGDAGTVARVDLKVAVRLPSGEVARFATNRRYVAGSTLLFRVTTSETTRLTLSREHTVLWTGELPPGEHDLPVAYSLEAGEEAARFVVEGGSAPAVLLVPAVSDQGER